MNDQNFLLIDSPNDYNVTRWMPSVISGQKTMVRGVSPPPYPEGVLSIVEIHPNFSFSKL